MSASLAPHCNEAKERYDSCFLKWYSEKYLRGNVTKDDCSSLFDEYKSCLASVLKERGIDKMLDGARNDHKGSDAFNLRKFKFKPVNSIYFNLILTRSSVEKN
ncbi:Uncharacterized protein GcM3_173017 [Golovinomyces cichoracearum]|uniref:Mitochondrial distribution and morphology protein 35 n=1 Tax=Golovinomyces cichoracearum TaxID=62708 RepID=A0A420HQ17_9PEZI|nr:Uncharacterized protein GcM3_173017 [Golovinomyces cichoracearum]